MDAANYDTIYSHEYFTLYSKYICSNITIYLHFILVGISNKENHRSQRVILIGFTLLGVISNSSFNAYFLTFTTLSLFLIFALSSWLSTRIIKVWLKLGQALGWINSRVLLTIMYIFVLTPIALLRKLTKKNIVVNLESTFFKNSQTFNPEFFEKMW